MHNLNKKREITVNNGKMEQCSEDQVKGQCNSSTKNLYLVPFFNFLFYLGYFPIKLEFNVAEGKYFTKSYKVQKVICALTQLGTIISITFITWYTVLEIFKEGSAMKTKVGITVFDIISNIGMIGTSVFTSYMGWGQRKLFLEVIEATRVYCESSRRHRLNETLVYAFCAIIMTFIGVIDWYMFQFYYGDQNKQPVPFTVPNEDFSKIDISSHGFNQFEDHIVNSSTNHNKSSISYNISSFEMAIGALWVYFAVFYANCQLVFIILIITLKHVEIDFERKLKAQGFCESSGLHQGMSLYKTLKTTTELIQSLFGDALIGFYMASVSYLAQAPYVLLGNRGEAERLIMVYIIFSMVVWVVAAEFHYKTRRTLMEWVGHHCDRTGLSMEDRFKLLTISGEISSAEMTTVALSNKCFPVTYRHLSTMVGLIVTYGIIVFQIQESSC